jgi:thiol-disulfide isomerase/thioredoxin
MQISGALRFVLLSAMVFFLLAVYNIWHKPAPENTIEIPLPAFELAAANHPDAEIDTAKYTPANWQGKKLLVVFWATWCTPCLMEIPTLNKLHQKYLDENFAIISINIDDEHKQQSTLPKAIKKYRIQYPVLLGNPEKSSAQFNHFNALPTAFLVDEKGIMRQQLTGAFSEAELHQKVQQFLEQ